MRRGAVGNARLCLARYVVRHFAADGFYVDCSYSMLRTKKKKKDRTSRQTQAGIGYSTPAHRDGHMQNRISRRQVRRGKIEHSAEAEQPRTD